MLPSNPYIAGNPVHEQDQFIGRQDVLRDVEQTLRNPSTNAIVLFGQRRIGKTSVLLHIEQELAAKKEFTPIYFDLQDKASLPLAKVLYQMAQKISLVAKVNLPKRKQFDRNGKFFRETFIPAAVKTSKSQGLVLLLDEFDVLDLPKHEQAGASFFPYLRDWMKIAEGIQFVFVLGRRPEELSTDTLSTFKGIRSQRVSLMTRQDSETIIRQSEKNASLTWSDGAVERVWHWTQGHPYFTQLLCSEIWETALTLNDIEETVRPDPSTSSGLKAFVEGSPSVRPELVEGCKPPTVNTKNVDAAIDAALEQGANAFQWIWNGLPPAERIVMAAMAEAKEDHISQDELTEILNRSKVRLILRELELAPETLISWDLLRPVDNTFRFAIPLLRRWVAAEKPLRRVKAELDSLEPLAESLYHSGEGFSKIGNLGEAERLLRNALDVNPNHFRARLLLAQVLLGKGNPAEAVEELEPAYEFEPRSSKSSLIKALLALAGTQDEEEQLATYDRVLELDPEQTAASEKKRTILQRQAEAALENEDLATALQLYQEIGDQDGINRIKTMQRKWELDKQVTLARKHEETEDWSAAIVIYEKLLTEFPDGGDWQARLKTAQTQKQLAETYTRALSALEKGDKELAQTLFGEIIGVQPDYRDAARYLLLAVKEIDVEALSEENRQARERITELQHQIEQILKSSVPPQKTEQEEESTSKQGQEFEFEVITVNEQGEEIKRSRGKARQQIEDLGNGVFLEMVYIPGGEFLMGSPETEEGHENSEGPQHKVTVTPFYMGKYPVTQEQWEAVMGAKKSWWRRKKSGKKQVNPSKFKGAKRPVENISWHDAVEFCKRLSEKTGHTYRLPSEAEWEYACRAGTTTPFHFGETITPKLANYGKKYEGTTDVGKFPPNAFGLYDMYGNVWEWCFDHFHESYDGAPSDGSVLEIGGDASSRFLCYDSTIYNRDSCRVLRGGSWSYDQFFCRSASRDFFFLNTGNSEVGFRAVIGSSAWTLL